MLFHKLQRAKESPRTQGTAYLSMQQLLDFSKYSTESNTEPDSLPHDLPLSGISNMIIPA